MTFLKDRAIKRFTRREESVRILEREGEYQGARAPPGRSLITFTLLCCDRWPKPPMSATKRLWPASAALTAEIPKVATAPVEAIGGRDPQPRDDASEPALDEGGYAYGKRKKSGPGVAAIAKPRANPLRTRLSTGPSHGAIIYPGRNPLPDPHRQRKGEEISSGP